MISRKECQRGKFEVRKMVTRRPTEATEAQHGDPMPTGTALPCRKTEEYRPAGWPGYPVLGGATVLPPFSTRRDLNFFEAVFEKPHIT